MRIEATFYTHNKLWAACGHYRDLALANPSGAFYLDLGAMLFAFFTVEAYVNYLAHAISRVLTPDERRRLDRAAVLKRVDLLAAKCNLGLDREGTPYKALRSLERLRNLLAHGRPEEKHHEDLNAEGDPQWLRSRIETTVTPEAAKDACGCVSAIIEALHAAARVKYPQERLPKRGLGGITMEQTSWG